MTRLRQVWRRLRALFRKNTLEAEMDEELRFHFEKQIEDNIRAGMTQQEARYAALRAFGGVEQVKEQCRDSRGIRLVEELGLRRFGLEYMQMDPWGFAPFPDGSHILFYRDLDRTCQSIAAISERDAEAYRAFSHYRW